MIYDVIGIGIGPFNLGLAALSDEIPELKTIFFDQNPEFQWHPGMMLPTATLQVPFYADLVTVVNPCSPFTFLNYLRKKQRLFRFAIHENNFITRLEYNDYCRWVITKLKNLHFNSRVENISYLEDAQLYRVLVRSVSTGTLKPYLARNIVLGTGTSPSLPSIVNVDHPGILHSSEYLNKKQQLLSSGSITIVGSGQSAAEIFYDLLQHTEHIGQINWITRSERFYPMEYSKFTLEMTSVDYIDHFYTLSPSKKQEVLTKQDALYKGINYALINDIYNTLYLKQLQEDPNISINTNSELKSVEFENDRLSLQFYHHECEEHFYLTTKFLILATGYQYQIPAFLNSLNDQLNWKDNFYLVSRNYTIDRNNTLYVQNAELHTHGFSAPDLGMGPCRNATILNSILGYEHFKLERNIAFQSFGTKTYTP